MASRLADSMLLFAGTQTRPIRSLKLHPLSSSAGTSSITWQRSCQMRLFRSRTVHQPWVNTVKNVKIAQAIAVLEAPSTPFPTADSAEYRRQLSESYGFQQIGETLPDDVTLRDIVSSLPKTVFELDDMKAWGSVLISVTSYALGILMIAKAPWYLLPLAWAYTGTAVTGFFVIGHDCAHKSFSRNKLVEDIVGTIAFMPLIYPYEPWRFKHDQHHAKTNMLHEDTAWHPILKADIDSSKFLRKALIYGYGPVRTWMSIAHWYDLSFSSLFLLYSTTDFYCRLLNVVSVPVIRLVWHFDLKKFRKHEVKRVIISLGAVFAFIGIGWPLIIYKAGIVGWIKFWLMPWLGYHFWMSTFTIVHHTAPYIPFKDSEEWNAAQAQLNGTVHCDYPHWIEVLCHDINWHIPHHLSPKIPSYNLRAAQQSLDDNWGKYLNKAKWNWRLMKTIMTTCHVYDRDENYVSFNKVFPEESQPITFLRRLMPDSP